MSQIINEKMNKNTQEIITYTVNFTDILGDSDIAIINSILPSPTSITISEQAMITTEITIDNQTIAAYKGITFDVAGGIDKIEYKIKINLTLSNGDILEVYVILFITNSNIDYYGSVAAADEYFSLRLNAMAWTDADTTDKLKALIQVTKAIDRLNFTNDLMDNNQLLQFPRGTDTEVPEDILIACYEEALQLLDDVDSQLEQANLSATSQGFSSARTTYNRDFVPENVRAGITSYTAWSYIVPYLRNPREIKVSRV